MRILPVILLAACAALAQTPDAPEFRVGDLATFSGMLPCADCYGVRVVFALRADGLFFRQRTILRTENAGQRQLDAGRWTQDGEMVTLVSSTAEAERYAIRGAGLLEPLGHDAKPLPCPAQASGHCSLLREEPARMPIGTYRLRGLYKRIGARQSFELCGGGPVLKVDAVLRPKLANNLAQAVASGKPALVEVTGVFQTPAASTKTPQFANQTLAISTVISATPGGACGELADLPKTEPVAKPISDTQAQSETPVPLLETNWILTELNGEPVAPAPERDRGAALRLLAQNRVAGSTGCNRFSASYSLEGRKLRFAQVAVTRMACPALMTQEEAFLKAMEATRQYELRRAVLVLTDDAGRALAQFRAVAVPANVRAQHSATAPKRVSSR